MEVAAKPAIARMKMVSPSCWEHTHHASKLGANQSTNGREFIEHGIEKCVVIVYIGSRLHHVEWSVTATRYRFRDTYQVTARKALRSLCQIYEEEVSDTPLRFFLPF
jgi:hypothetical protein